MKKLSLQIVAILFFNVILLAQEDWFWVNPLPQGNDLNDVFILDENTIIAVGDRGTLLRSENGGEDWEINYRISNIDEDLVDIQFVSSEKGFLLANDPLSKILLTDDKGINWKVISEFDTIHINDMCFINESEGWIIGTSEELGIILKTTDGGYNWDTMILQNDSSNWGFSTIQFIDSMNGWAAGKGPEIPLFGWAQGELLKTTDGGENWSIVNDSLSVISRFQFLNSDIGWLTQYYMAFYSYTGLRELKKTTDGGLTWEAILTADYYSTEAHHCQYLYFLNSDTGWVKLGNDLHKTTDGGISWIVPPISSPNDGAIHFCDLLNGCTVGNSGRIFITQDAGQSWTERSTLSFNCSSVAVDFYDNNLGWITTYDVYRGIEWNEYNGRICCTTNGGISWEEQLYIQGWHNSDGIINDIQSIDNNTIYAVGRNVYKTTNSGADWTTLDYPGIGVYKKLFFQDENTGFVGAIGGHFGDAGLYKTTDGGTQWDIVLTIPVESIFFTNNSNGWLISGHNIYKTSDGGNNWSLIWTNNFDLKSICFADGELGLAVGNEGYILRTINGGSSWDNIFNKAGYELNSVAFTSSDKAVAVGQGEGDGIIISIDNVGGAYSIQWESWTPGLNDVYFLDDNNGWAVGNGGTIIKTGEGVSFVEEEEVSEIPTNYYLSNNFPNPFNPSTKIKYSIPQSSNVIIKVFDILGNEIETLINEQKPTGTYEITWYTEGLPSGVYFYRIQSGGFNQTKKMLLLK